jgi:hypothetical protein
VANQNFSGARKRTINRARHLSIRIEVLNERAGWYVGQNNGLRNFTTWKQCIDKIGARMDLPCTPLSSNYRLVPKYPWRSPQFCSLSEEVMLDFVDPQFSSSAILFNISNGRHKSLTLVMRSICSNKYI